MTRILRFAIPVENDISPNGDGICEGARMGKPLEYITVKDAYNLYKVDACKVKSGELVHKAIKALMDNPASITVYVVDSGNKVIGCIPMMDIIRVTAARFGVRKSGVRAYFQYYSDILDTTVDDMMRQTLTIKEDDELVTALKLMADYNLTDLPVVDKDGHLLGELNGIEMLRFGYEGVKKGDEKYTEVSGDEGTAKPKKG
jgi:CBS domain-containing protein